MNTEFRLPRLVREDARARARALRLRPSEAEVRLWEQLRKGGLGARFRRQQAVGPYVVDFFAAGASLALVIEEEPQREDFREVELARHGVRLVRLHPQDVATDPEACLGRIREELRVA